MLRIEGKLKRRIESITEFVGKDRVWTRGSYINGGAMGVIYEATTPSLKGTDFVIKIGDDEGVFTEHIFFDRYLSQERLDDAAKKFGHPIYLPAAIDTGTFVLPERKSDLYFIVMERYNTPIIFGYPLMNDDIFCRLVTDILYSLKYFHSFGFFHGDIKSDNILERDGDYYLCDFGITTTVLTAYNIGVSRHDIIDGTPGWAGRDMHETGHGPSYRADLDNLIFCMVTWAVGGLPWEDAEDAQDCYEGKQLFMSAPSYWLDCASSYKKGCIELFVEYAQTLEFENSLDFDGLLRILGKVTPLKDVCKKSVKAKSKKRRLTAANPYVKRSGEELLEAALYTLKRSVEAFNILIYAIENGRS